MRGVGEEWSVPNKERFFFLLGFTEEVRDEAPWYPGQYLGSRGIHAFGSIHIVGEAGIFRMCMDSLCVSCCILSWPAAWATGASS